MTWIVEPPPPASLPVRGTDARFPVHRIFCVGRNYAAHTREMGGDPRRDDPLWFNKSPASLIGSGVRLTYPPGTDDLQHEVELVVAVGAETSVDDGAVLLDMVFGYAVGLDLTRRDLQGEAKRQGRPWALAKDFEGSAVVSEIVPVSGIGHPTTGRISLTVDGQTRQDADLGSMIWTVPQILADLLRYHHRLRPGDLVFTGTPEGVGPVEPGQRLVGAVEGVAEVVVDVTDAPAASG